METKYRSLFSFLAARAEAMPENASRRVLSRDQALALAAFVKEVVGVHHEYGLIRHKVTVTATQRMGYSPLTADVDQLTLMFPTHLGSNVQVMISTNVRDAATLRRVIDHAFANRTPLPPYDTTESDQLVNDQMMHSRPITYAPVSLWHESTVEAMQSKYGEALAQLSLPFRGTDWRGLATVANSAEIFLNQKADDSLTTWGEATDSEVSVTARSIDGSAVGWSGQASRDWAQLRLDAVASEALATAERMQKPSRAEPGRYTAILSPTAVGQLLREMAPFYNVERAGPFDPPTRTAVGQRDRHGERVFDRRVTLSSDPSDPDGGAFPFFDDGTPNDKVTWIDQGILRYRSVDSMVATLYGMIARKDPWTVRMSGGPTTVAEMIANCERGLYVHRFSSLQVVNGTAGMLTGFTRDGCSLILNGKMARPVKDFRIYESPFLMLNRVVALGQPQRVAFGFTPPHAYAEVPEWPLPPIIAPPIMVTDFNFEALADMV